jgi:hypothetical protein
MFPSYYLPLFLTKQSNRGNMESEGMDLIVKNVKIDKIIFVETYICEE